MDSRNMLLPWLAMVMVLVLVGSTKGDFDQDKQKCADQLIGLATCLPYVSGQAKAPTMDCCSGLKPVLQKSKVCLCILVRDRDDPNLGLKINATLALGLPDSCHTPSNITECPKLLNLAPNSPEAKIFEDFGKNANKKGNSTVTAPGNAIGSSGDIKSDVGRGKKWFGVEKIWGLFLYMTIMLLFQVA